MHMLLLELLRSGMSLEEARSLGIEELLCFVAHLRLERELNELDEEAARIASLPFAEEQPRQHALSALRLKGRGLIEKFYRQVLPEG